MATGPPGGKATVPSPLGLVGELVADADGCGAIATDAASSAAWLAVAVPSAINARAPASTALAATRRIRVVVVLVVISVLLSALVFRFISRCVPVRCTYCA
jgi:uncharacterized membrane protein YcfT